MSPMSAVRSRVGTLGVEFTLNTQINVQMAEWSKAPDSSSGLERGVGSNPTLDNGDVAHLVERFLCKEEAPGSKPGISNMLPWCNG